MADSPTRPKLLLTVREAGEQLSVSARSVWRLIASGDLAVVRCGRSVRATAESIAAFVRRGGTSR